MRGLGGILKFQSGYKKHEALRSRLYLCEKFIGIEKREEIMRDMDYFPGEFEIVKVKTAHKD